MKTSNRFILPGAMKVNRRGLIQGGAAMAGVALLGGRMAFAQTPTRGGTLRLSYPTPVDSTDPMATLTVSGQQLAAAIFDKLTHIGPDGFEVMPALATSWTPEAHGQEWVVELRQGVRFHDGLPFTSADVVATVERSLDRATAGRAYGAYGPLAEIRAEGEHTVRFILTQPYAELPFSLGQRWSNMLPAHKIDTIATDLIGTGPFKIADHTPGASTSVVRNPDYWMEGAPYLDGVIITPLPESVSQQAALRSGDVDILNQIGAETYLSLRNASDVNSFSLPTPNHQVLFTLASKDPFTDAKVRQAFRYLIDREGLLAAALLGQGTIGNDVPLLATDPMIPELPQNNQDLPRARALLAEAGVTELDINCWTSSERPPSPKIALALQQGAAQVGITINIRDIPYTQYVSDVSRKEPLYTAQWAAQYDNYSRLYQNYHSNGGLNYSGVETVSGLDPLLEDIIAEVDAVRRKDLIGQALVKIHTGSDRIIPFFQNVFGAYSERVMGYTPPLGDIINLKALWIAQ